MADKSLTDLVMKFEYTRNNPVWAESTLQIADHDPLMEGFLKNTDYDNYNNFFEVTNFNFSAELDESDQSTAVKSQNGRTPSHQATSPSSGSFSRWYQFGPKDLASHPYPVKQIKGSFDRIIDSASPIFFQYCCNKTPFDNAVLVKRISQGDRLAVKRPSVGYLRIEFGTVLLSSLAWDDGDVVTEKCEFTCKHMKIRYLRQSADGTVGLEGGEASAEWTDKTRANQSRGGFS
jgi:type VI protein secretion system component Hcp